MTRVARVRRERSQVQTAGIRIQKRSGAQRPHSRTIHTVAPLTASKRRRRTAAARRARPEGPARPGRICPAARNGVNLGGPIPGHTFHLVGYDQNVEVARHERWIAKGNCRLDLDYYLQALIRKPSLPRCHAPGTGPVCGQVRPGPRRLVGPGPQSARRAGQHPGVDRGSPSATRICAAIVDHLTFNGTIIETGTNSYHLASAQARAAEPAAASWLLAASRPRMPAVFLPTASSRSPAESTELSQPRVESR